MELTQTLKSLKSLHTICKINIPKIVTLDGENLFLTTTLNKPYKIKLVKDDGVNKYYYYSGGIHLTYPEKAISEYGGGGVGVFIKEESALSGREDQRTTIKIWQKFSNQPDRKTLIMVFIFNESTKEYVTLYVKKRERYSEKTEFIITRKRMNDILSKLD